jgi:hypothetical protein
MFFGARWDGTSVGYVMPLAPTFGLLEWMRRDCCSRWLEKLEDRVELNGTELYIIDTFR